MKQPGNAAQAQILVGYLKAIVMEIMIALAIYYVDLITTVLIHSHMMEDSKVFMTLKRS